MSDVVVALRDVHRTFGSTVAVDGVSLEVQRGEIFGLLGPSGCGKTTILRMIAGLESPDRGTVFLAGVDVTDQPAHHRDVHTVFQSYALFPRMTTEDNVRFGLAAARVDTGEAGLRVREMLSLVGLTGKERRRPNQLSGGEQQRVALARALVNRPSVLLLDEPLAALDAHLRREMQAELRRLQRETGCTFVLVTHDQDEAFAMCDRVAVMFKGQVAQVGSPEALYRRPVSVEVATFIGQSSVVPAIWSDGAAVVAGGWRVHAASAVALDNDQECALLLRPRQLRLVSSQGLPGRIRHTAFSEDRFEATIETSAGIVRVETDARPGAIGTPVVVGTDGTPAWAIRRTAP